jgi:hypothetical protein
MTILRVAPRFFFAVGICSIGAAGACARVHAAGTPPSDSEVAASVVSGALNNSGGSPVAMRDPAPTPSRSVFARLAAAVNPIRPAWAAEWSCRGGNLSPAFSGPGADPYVYTPVSCSVTWGNMRTASSTWSGPFTLDYGSKCDGVTPFLEDQSPGCSVTRTTGVGGDTRTITGPDGNSYAITHDTQGAGTGWDTTVSPAPANGGVQVSCATAGCGASRTLVIGGSHLTGNVTIDGKQTTIWDHTVSTGAAGLTVTGVAASRVVNGTVTVQHNLARYTATATFESVGYGEPGCCFPTSGSVSTVFDSGSDKGKTETLRFTALCGEATLTNADGSSEDITLQHCL